MKVINLKKLPHRLKGQLFILFGCNFI